MGMTRRGRKNGLGQPLRDCLQGGKGSDMGIISSVGKEDIQWEVVELNLPTRLFVMVG